MRLLELEAPPRTNSLNGYSPTEVPVEFKKCILVDFHPNFFGSALSDQPSYSLFINGVVISKSVGYS